MMFDFKSEEVHIYFVEDERKVSMSFFLDKKPHIMNRPVDELMGKTLKRVGITLAKCLGSKKSKVKKGAEIQKTKVELPISIVDSTGLPVDTSILCNSDWKTGMVLTAGASSFLVVVNAPRVTSMGVFPNHRMYANNIIVAQPQFEFSDCFEYNWFRERGGDDMVMTSGADVGQAQEEYVFVSCGSKFTPTAECIGRRIKVYCTPIMTSDAVSDLAKHAGVSSDDVVAQQNLPQRGRSVVYHIPGYVHENGSIPYMCTIRKDLKVSSSSQCGDHASTAVRIASYNILADPYATSDFSKEVLYNYISKLDYLELAYRCPMVVKEVLHYSMDILCLQEVDQKVYQQYLVPLLSDSPSTAAEAGAAMRWDGFFSCKGIGGSNEGCATFINSQKFNVMKNFTVQLKDEFATNPLFHGLYALRPDIESILTTKLGTIGQISICQDKCDEKLGVLVINTHLFYHPAAGYIRLLQTFLLLKKAACWKDHLLGVSCMDAEVADPINGCILRCGCFNKVSVMFIGDLNSTPETAVIEFIESGKISSEHEVWKTMNEFAWGMRMEFLSEDQEPGATVDISLQQTSLADIMNRDFAEISHPFRFASACEKPQYTNYTVGFKDLLDYIYVDPSEYSTISIGEFPSEEVLAAETAIPSTCFPSDHIALVVDIQRTV